MTMTITSTVQSYLRENGVEPETVTHPKTPSASRTAQASHVPGERVAKGVLLKDENGYLLAVIPATHHIEMQSLSSLTGRNLSLAEEDEVADAFPDCALGAVPPIGAPYGLETVVDDSLMKQPQTYLEGGDHATLLQVTAEEFARLNRDARHGAFSRHD
jgi:Ala-tRNA(Pro) deacylase